jgi:hypothetical protein
MHNRATRLTIRQRTTTRCDRVLLDPTKPKGDNGETMPRSPRTPVIGKHKRHDALAKIDRRVLQPPRADAVRARERAEPGFLWVFLMRLHRACVEEYDRVQEQLHVRDNVDAALKEARSVLLAQVSPVWNQLRLRAKDGSEWAAKELLAMDECWQRGYWLRKPLPSEIQHFDRVASALKSALPKPSRPMSVDRMFVLHALEYATTQEVANALGRKSSAASVRTIKYALKRDPALSSTRRLRLTPHMIVSIDYESIVVPDPSEWPDEEDQDEIHHPEAGTRE